ncbi:hypothetical protein NKG05_05495 [Oerskovia sp. M15]
MLAGELASYLLDDSAGTRRHRARWYRVKELQDAARGCGSPLPWPLDWSPRR